LTGHPICRDKVRDLTLSLLSVVYSDGVEPALQSVEGEPLQFATANRDDGFPLDVVTRDFWDRSSRYGGILF